MDIVLAPSATLESKKTIRRRKWNRIKLTIETRPRQSCIRPNQRELINSPCNANCRHTIINIEWPELGHWPIALHFLGTSANQLLSPFLNHKIKRNSRYMNPIVDPFHEGISQRRLPWLSFGPDLVQSTRISPLLPNFGYLLAQTWSSLQEQRLSIRASIAETWLWTIWETIWLEYV